MEIVITYTLCVPVILIGSFRLYVRRKNYWWDDLCAAVAMFAFMGQAVLMGLITNNLRAMLAYLLG